MSYTANFRRFTTHVFSKAELALVEALERQRHRTGRVRCVLDSPSGQFTAVLQAYIAYIRHLTKRDAIIVDGRRPASAVSSKNSQFPIPKSQLRFTPRSYLRILGTRQQIGQILLLDADKYCPSIPLYRSRLEAILTIALPYLNGPNTVVIVQGNTNTPRNTAFKKYYQNWESQPDPFFITLSSPFHCAEAARPQSPQPRQKPKLAHVTANCAYIIHISTPGSAPLSTIRRAQIKIAA